MGESGVSGAVTPDQFVVDKDSLEILEKVVGSKAVWLVCAEQGIVEEDVPEELRHSLCLTNEEAKKSGIGHKFGTLLWHAPVWGVGCGQPLTPYRSHLLHADATASRNCGYEKRIR